MKKQAPRTRDPSVAAGIKPKHNKDDSVSSCMSGTSEGKEQFFTTSMRQGMDRFHGNDRDREIISGIRSPPSRSAKSVIYSGSVEEDTSITVPPQRNSFSPSQTKGPTPDMVFGRPSKDYHRRGDPNLLYQKE
eukprot:TRINITY_DN30754_c0_g1_i1.p1 TRINITY_DN30754_c0_g1~~TRINITY_DN30754_c0_g1_i1.p1  ORF type:complete len:133 (-),score=15.49 TRINITY_DN30754_c0_g1_i1:104-502(-)